MKTRKTDSSRAVRTRSTGQRRPLTLRREERIKCLAAISRVRRGEASSVTAAARAERTTVSAIKALVPKAITQSRPRSRIRVRRTDRYSAKVEILGHAGAMTATARGSRQRELAGQHRATVMRVLAGKEPASALEQYRGKNIGGHELISDYARLSTLAKAGVLGQLDALYVSPNGGR